MPEISIIIPVYNREEYLAPGIKSITGQSFNDFEVILVDDGSKQPCAAECDRLAALDNRIKVIHTENGGPSKARNTGIKAASGRYIMFVDSDDELENGALEGISAEIHQGFPDIVIGNINYISANGNTINLDNDITDERLVNETGADAVVKYFMDKGYFWPNVRWIIKKEFLEANGLYFYELVRSQEDIDLVPRLISAAVSFRLYNKKFYRYITRKNGISGATTFNKFSEMMKICGRLWEFSLHQSGVRKDYMRLGCAVCVKTCAENYGKFTASEKKIFKKWYLENNYASECLKGKKAAALLIKILGKWAGLMAYTALASAKGKIKGKIN